MSVMGPDYYVWSPMEHGNQGQICLGKILQYIGFGVDNGS